METDALTRGIQFNSFIALNRYLNREIFHDSKLLALIIYIALRVKRSNDDELENFSGISLNVGEFIIGRLKTVQDTDFSEQEYRSRFKKLQTLKIIEIIKITNKYTKAKWLENGFIDLNLESLSIQPNNQQISNHLTTNNNINNNSSSFISNKSNYIFINTDYELVVNKYIELKGLKEVGLRGQEIKDCELVIKKMFDSQRTSDQIIKCMKWFKEHEDDESQSWIRNWTISTVQKKMPEILAGKLKAFSLDEEYPNYSKMEQ